MKTLLALFILSCGLSGSAQAEESANLVQAAVHMRAAFRCSALASVYDWNPHEEQRLFDYGYEMGRLFVAGWRSGRVSIEEFPSEKRFGFDSVVKMQNPSDEFMLGRLFMWEWHLVQNEMSKLVSDGPSALANYAEREFSDGNCSLIGM